MRKIFFVAIFAVISPIFTFAQTEVALPKAGLTPDSPFYFLDRLGETLQQFFTINPAGKAKLQIKFAAERISEIEVVFESKGIEAKGIAVAQNRLEAHIDKAVAILAEEKTKGQDISQLALELGDTLGASKNSLKQTFKEQERALEVKEDDLKVQLRAARRSSDTVLEQLLLAELGQIKAQQELLEIKGEEFEDDLEEEEERLEEALEAEADALKKITKAQREKEEVIREAQEEGVELPANAFAGFDSLLNQAQAAFDAGNFQEAEQLARQAKKQSLESVEDTIEELGEMMEEEEGEEEDDGDDEDDDDDDDDDEEDDDEE